MPTVGEHPIPAGPLAVRWLGWELREPPRAGSLTYVDVALENAGKLPWRGIELSYHWLDDRGNAIIWGERWTPLPRTIEPGTTLEHRAELRGPLGPGRRRAAGLPAWHATLHADHQSGTNDGEGDKARENAISQGVLACHTLCCEQIRKPETPHASRPSYGRG